MVIEALGHKFTCYGAEEMLCRACGYVIWTVDSTEAATQAILMISSDDPRGVPHCGGGHHNFIYMPRDNATIL